MRSKGYVETSPGNWVLSKSLLRQPNPESSGVPVDREAKLHQDIMDWCDSQWPRWKFIHSRMDMKSTIGKGVNDFTVFGQFPLCILVECKKKDGKLDDDQRNWAHELKLLGWTVHVVRSIEEFKDIINTYKT